MSERWILFPEVAERTDGIITVGQTGLPEGVSDSLELHVDALQRALVRWGGYKAINLSAHLGDTDEVATSETIRSDTLSIQWNIQYLDKELTTAERPEPTVRAKQLNMAIRRAAIAGVWRHNTIEALGDQVLDVLTTEDLTNRLIKANPLAFDASASVGALWLTIQGDVKLAGLLLTWPCVSGILRHLRAYYLRHNEVGHDTEVVLDPLFASIWPGRAAIGARILATNSLVRPVRALE